MAEVFGDGTVDFEVNGAAAAASVTPAQQLTVSGSFKEGLKSSSRRRTSVRPSFDADNEFITLLHGSDPVKVELNRLENEVRGLNVVRSSGFWLYFAGF